MVHGRKFKGAPSGYQVFSVFFEVFTLTVFSKVFEIANDVLLDSDATSRQIPADIFDKISCIHDLVENLSSKSKKKEKAVCCCH